VDDYRRGTPAESCFLGGGIETSRSAKTGGLKGELVPLKGLGGDRGTAVKKEMGCNNPAPLVQPLI